MFKFEVIHLPIGRPFSWRALAILIALQLVGNILSVPMLRFENSPIEPVYFWILMTAASGIMIGIALFLGERTGLGAPLLEGFLKGEQLSAWLKRVFALSLIFSGIAIPYVVVVNMDLEPGNYPTVWKPVVTIP